MSKSLHKNQSGFTLAELLVVIIVASILSIVVANFIADWLEQATLAQTRASLLQTDEQAINTITNDILLSGSADTNNRWPDANGPNGNSYGWTSGSQTLILAKIAVDTTGNVIYSDSAKYITLKDNEIYFLTGTTLYRRTLSSGQSNDAAKSTCPASDASSSCPVDMTVATGVTNLSFTYYDANNDVVTPDNARSVEIAITTSSNINSQTIYESYSTRMVFRND